MNLDDVATHKTKDKQQRGWTGRVAAIVDDELVLVVVVGGRDKGTRCWIGNIGLDYLIIVTWSDTATTEGSWFGTPLKQALRMSLRSVSLG